MVSHYCRIRVRIPTRASSKKKEARGIYQHVEVIPGRDWVTPTANQGTMLDNITNHRCRKFFEGGGANDMRAKRARKFLAPPLINSK